MSELLPLNSLVLYKKRPAKVVRIGERLEIELEGGNLAKIRVKDVTLLHPGPLMSLGELTLCEGELELAWDLMSESPEKILTLAELSEIIYGEYTPSTAWSAWQVLEDGLYFRGSPEAVLTCTPHEVTHLQETRQRRKEEAEAWIEFLKRARIGQISHQEDEHYLKEVEDLALGRKKECRLLHELGRSERPENAYALLVESGYWTNDVDPYPTRLGLPSHPPQAGISPLVDEPRLDLTSIPAYAIDDSGNQDPDDAISLVSCRLDNEGNFTEGHLWVHIADVAAMVSPESKVDLEARSRGATLYLPEGAVPMLPLEAVQLLGLGLNEISPALSFGLEINAAGDIGIEEIKPSLVKVKRFSYQEVEDRITEEPFLSLSRITQRYQDRRINNGALSIDLPEVNIRIKDKQVIIQPIPRLKSRNLVREAMLMVGEAAAEFAIQKGLPIPFATQEAPSSMVSTNKRIIPSISAEDLAAHYAVRRNIKRSQVSSSPAVHAGVGLPAYTRATSPLRRYLDLVVHQQLRAYLLDQPILNSQEILERVGTSEAITGLVAQAENLARRHWTLVYLMQHEEWRGEGILVEKEGFRGTVIIPELALESTIQLREDLPLNSPIPLGLSGINLAELDVFFLQL